MQRDDILALGCALDLKYGADPVGIDGSRFMSMTEPAMAKWL